MGVILDELKEIENKRKRVIKQVATELFSELIRITPVGNPALWKINEGRSENNFIKPQGYSGGTLKQSWELIPQPNGDYKIFNPQLYASVRLSPYVNEGGVQLGSKQNPTGITPTLERFDRILQQKLNQI